MGLLVRRVLGGPLEQRVEVAGAEANRAADFDRGQLALVREPADRRLRELVGGRNVADGPERL
jgi:hypothetical protein